MPYNSKFFSAEHPPKEWTKEEINYYLSILETADSEFLRELLLRCDIKMFSEKEPIDKEQAVSILTKEADVNKRTLFKNIDILLRDNTVSINKPKL